MKWINAKDQRPEPSKTVLCWVKNPTFGCYAMCGAWFPSERDGSWLLDDGEDEGLVTHWMLLPDEPSIWWSPTSGNPICDSEGIPAWITQAARELTMDAEMIPLIARTIFRHISPPTMNTTTAADIHEALASVQAQPSNGATDGMPQLDSAEFGTTKELREAISGPEEFRDHLRSTSALVNNQEEQRLRKNVEDSIDNLLNFLRTPR